MGRSKSELAVAIDLPPLGMCGGAVYRRSWEWKLEWYSKNGFTPGENLFATEEDRSGGLDQAELTKVAHEIDGLL